MRSLLLRGSLALFLACGLAVAACADEEEPPSRPSNEDGVDIPVPASSIPPSSTDMPAPAASIDDDEPDPITGPPVLIPPTDTSEASGTSARGGRCSMNADCVPGLSCASAVGRSNAGFEIIAGGYCSSACASDVDCASVGEASRCHKGLFGIPTGFCTLPCDPGAPEADKCNGRDDLVCFGSPGQPGSCNPTCGSDDQCGSTGFCGFGTGQCRSTPLDPGTPVGGLCPQGEPVTCTGFCTGELDQDAICTGPCRVGSPCGNDPALRCVPTDTDYRRGDFGLCEQPCNTSADCTPGIAVCAPTGLVTSTGAPERTCAYALSVPSTTNQRLSVEELALPTTPAGLIGVRAFTPLDSVFRLSAGDDGVCVTGTLTNADSPIVLVFQFGSNDAVPFDASAFSAFAIEHTSTRGIGLQAQLSNHPGVFYRNEVAEGLAFPLPEGTNEIPFSEMAPLVAGGPAWDPAQLEAVRLVVGAGEAPGPFEACVQRLGFE